MLNTVRSIFWGILALMIATTSFAQNSASSSNSSSKSRRSVTVVFEDGHRQSFPLADIARIEFKDPAEIVFKDGHQQSLALSEFARLEFSSSAVSASRLPISCSIASSRSSPRLDSRSTRATRTSWPGSSVLVPAHRRRPE